MDYVESLGIKVKDGVYIDYVADNDKTYDRYAVLIEAHEEDFLLRFSHDVYNPNGISFESNPDEYSKEDLIESGYKFIDFDDLPKKTREYVLNWIMEDF